MERCYAAGARRSSLAGTPSGGREVRRYDGTTFVPGVALTAGGDASEDHVTQAAAGRLHGVFPQGQADGLHLVHATSDDGASWRSGTVLSQTGGLARAASASSAASGSSTRARSG